LRYLRLPSRGVMLGAALLSALCLSFSLGWSVPTVSAAGPANSQASELVRLINGERAALGKAPLRVDSFLAGKARDGAVACPNDSSLVAAGRAEDFAVHGFPANAHQLRLCPVYTSMDAMKAWGYRGNRGEVTALNGGYGTTKVAYAYGCSPSVRTCPGATTSTYYTTARVLTNWTSSTTHYNVIVGRYDRIGCGAWVGANGAFYYDCMVSLGGRAAPRPVATPRPPTATTAPAAAISSPTALSTAGPTASPMASPASTAPALAAMAAPSEAVAGVSQNEQGGPQSDPPGRSAAPAMSSSLGVAAGALAAILSLGYGALVWLRKRRRRGRPAQG
jgi:hypothetical protein